MKLESTPEELAQALAETRARLSKRITMILELTEGDLAPLRNKWRRKHEKAAKRWPLLPPFTDELLVRYIIYDAKSKMIRRWLKNPKGQLKPE